MNSKKKNILKLFLESLNVKYTHEYTDRLYRKHSGKHPLVGMLSMLSDYQVETKSIRMNNKDEIHSLELPFMAMVNGEFVLIQKLTNEYVYCIRGEQQFEIPLEEFKDAWGGVSVLAEKTERTAEPGYKGNYRNQLFRTIRKNALGLSALLATLIGFVTNGLYLQLDLCLLLLINIAGGYIGYLLIQKQLSGYNRQADRICSLFKKGNCDDILYSPAARFMGVIGWSEVGFSYFIANILVIILFPHLIH